MYDMYNLKAHNLNYNDLKKKLTILKLKIN